MLITGLLAFRFSIYGVTKSKSQGNTPEIDQGDKKVKDEIKSISMGVVVENLDEAVAVLKGSNILF